MSKRGTIYVLHIEPAYAHARHYVGFTERSAEERFREHRETKEGSPLVRAALASGCDVSLVASFPGTRDEERELKDRKNARALCPRCREGFREEAAERMRRIRQNRRDRERREREWREGAGR